MDHRPLLVVFPLVAACSLAYLTDHAGEADGGADASIDAPGDAALDQTTASDAGGGDGNLDGGIDAPPGRWSLWADGATGFADLGGVWGANADDVWAVGFGEIEHWDGGTWTTWPGSVASGNLSGVWGSAANDVWAVGASGLLLHYDGSAWLPVDAGTGADLGGVWGTAASDVWAAASSAPGQGFILHFDGSTWSMVLGIDAGLNAVGGTKGGTVWAVGHDNAIMQKTQGTWSRATVQDDVQNELVGVWASDASAWAVGASVILGYGSEVWLPASPAVALNGVWGSAPNDVWGVGFGGTIYHYDGASWSPSNSGTNAGLGGVWGTGPRDVWAVGTKGTILHFQ
jgi:hypothetical protein